MSAGFKSDGTCRQVHPCVKSWISETLFLTNTDNVAECCFSQWSTICASVHKNTFSTERFKLFIIFEYNKARRCAPANSSFGSDLRFVGATLDFAVNSRVLIFPLAVSTRK